MLYFDISGDMEHRDKGEQRLHDLAWRYLRRRWSYEDRHRAQIEKTLQYAQTRLSFAWRDFLRELPALTKARRLQAKFDAWYLKVHRKGTNMDEQFSVGDIVTRAGDDRHVVTEIGAYNDMTVRCTVAPASGWCKVGDIEGNLQGRYRLVERRTTSVLEPCPLCDARAEIRDYRYQGAHASGMETLHPFVECTNCRLKTPPVPCDDSPYGQKAGAKPYRQARAEAEIRWNTRPMSLGSFYRGLPLPSLPQKLGIVGVLMLDGQCQITLASGEGLTAPAYIGEWLTQAERTS
jgi:hypothetical protein